MVFLELTEIELKVLQYIKNRLIRHSESPSVRDIMDAMGYNSPRSAAYILEKLKTKKYIDRSPKGNIRLIKDLPESDTHANTIEVPLLGSIPCGRPIISEENIECFLPVSTKIARSPYKYFFLRAIGDSMNVKGIQDGNLVLVQQQSTAENGDSVVVQINGEAIIKEYHRKTNAVVLKPKSSNQEHQPIILTEDFKVLGIVKTVIDLESELYE